MKKLGKSINTRETIEAYLIGCGCECICLNRNYLYNYLTQVQESTYIV